MLSGADKQVQLVETQICGISQQRSGELCGSTDFKYRTNIQVCDR